MARQDLAALCARNVVLLYKGIPVTPLRWVDQEKRLLCRYDPKTKKEVTEILTKDHSLMPLPPIGVAK